MTTELSFLLLTAGLLLAIHLVEVTHNLIGNGLIRALHGYQPFDKPEWRERLAATEGNLAKCAAPPVSRPRSTAAKAEASPS